MATIHKHRSDLIGEDAVLDFAPIPETKPEKLPEESESTE